MKEKFNTTKFVKGSLLSFVFGIFGSVPWIVAAAFINFYIGWLAYLIGIAAYKGFLLGYGRMNKSGVYIIVIVVIFCVGLSQFVSTIIEMIQLDIQINVHNLNVIFTSWIYWRESLINLIIAYVIAFLGIWQLIAGIVKNETKYKL